MAIKGYKVFNSDWTCSPDVDHRKQYACPGYFEEDVIPVVCGHGMHFCKKAADCFRYYSFDPDNHVAEVIARGTIAEDGDKCATDKLEIVRELSWAEVLEMVNTGKGCAGLCNSGNRNSGDWNSGNRNSGNRNSGDCNSGDRNSGDWNSGDCNSGDRNSGDCNSGDRNSGDWNSGNRNSGNRNSGNRNSGDCNSGDWNSGDWNKTNFSNGCFNTVEPKIYLFNKPSDWTYRDWRNSFAYELLSQIDNCPLEYVYFDTMTPEEKAAHPEAEVTGGYLKKRTNEDNARSWWHELTEEGKNTIRAIPNFDAAIAEAINGNFEYSLEYGENKKGYNTFKIKEVYILED